MNKNQKNMWNMLQGNKYHEWIAAELIAPPVTKKQPFFDPIMTAGFVLIAIVAVFNMFL